MRGNRQPPWQVAHVIGSLGVGGAERQLVNYLLAADKREFRHTVLCLSAPRELAAELDETGVTVRAIGLRMRRLAPGLWRLCRWLQVQRVAIVHTHMFHAALWGRLAGMAAGVPVLVTTEHGKELWKNRLQVWCDRALSRRTCKHIAVSRDGMQIRMARERVPADKIMHIPNGVPVGELDGERTADTRARLRAELGLRVEQPVLGTVGRVVKAKDYPRLLEAFAALRRERPDLHWLQVGTGDALDDLRQRARQAGLYGAITFAGSRPDVSNLLAAMDVFVMSSLREGLPMALLEAMAAGCPVVVTAVGGMPEVVEDGVNGLVVPPADPEALAGAVSRLLRERALAERLARTAHARVRDRYGIEGAARRIEAIYRDCLRAKGLSG